MSTSKPKAIKLSFDQPADKSKTYQLNVETGNRMTEAFVIDGNYNVVARGAGSISAKLKGGRYQLKYRVGSTSKEQWVDLTEDRLVKIRPEDTVPISCAPIDPDNWPDTLLSAIQSFAGDCSLLIVIKDLEKKIPHASMISLIDSHGSRKRLEKLTLGDDKVVVLRFPKLNAGAYRLQVGSLHNSPVEMCVWVTANHQTQVYFERCQINRIQSSGSINLKERAPYLRTAAITILSKNLLELKEVRKLWRLTEMARGSLAELREVVPVDETLMTVVHQKFECPMLGLLGGHLILNALAREGEDAKSDLTDLMDTVIENLSTLFGATCPDVVALRFARHKEKNFVVRMPPMLVQSWDLLAPNADVKNIPKESLASQIGVALTTIRPWLVWKIVLLPTTQFGAKVETQYMERQILRTKKTQRKIGALATQYSLPRSTVRTILGKLDSNS